MSEIDNTEHQDAATDRAGSPRWITLAVLGITGLFYAYAVWNAVSHLLGLLPAGLTGMGWITLLFAVVFPMLIFVFAYAIGRRRSVWQLLLVLVAGLGIVAVFWLSLLGYSVSNLGSLTGTTL